MGAQGGSGVSIRAEAGRRQSALLTPAYKKWHFDQYLHAIFALSFTFTFTF